MNDNRPAWFDALLAQYEPFLRAQCRRLTPDTAEDTYQEAVCRALATWHKYRADGHFPTWLNYIVRHIRSDGRRREFKRPLRMNVIQGETQETVLLIKEALSSDKTGMLKLSAVGYTQKEISETVRLNRRDVGLMLREARAAVGNDNNGVAKVA